MRTPSLNWSHLVVCLIGCLAVGAVGGGIVAADESYDLTVTDAVEVPTQTIEHDTLHKDYEIDAFAVREPGEPLTVSATVPDGEAFYVELYNSDQRLEDVKRIEGSETVTFDGSVTNALAPGTYSLRLNEIDGPIQALHPVVISGYEVSISHPLEAERDGEFEVTIDVTPTVLEDDPADVEIVLWNDSETITEPASGSDGEYSASVDLDGVDIGEYNIYVAALGEDEFRGQQEILDLSEGETIEIVGSDAANGDGDGDANGDGNGDGEGDRDENGDESAPDNGEPINGNGTQPPDEDAPVTNETDAEPSADGGNETESESTPIMPTESEATSTPEDQSGFGVLAAVGALAFAVCSCVGRRSRD